MELTFRYAQEQDLVLILRYLSELALFEKMKVKVTEELLRKWMFEEGIAEAVIAVVDGQDAGIVLFSHSFAAFLGKPSISMEAIYVDPRYRNRGVGKGMFRELGRLAVARGYGRVECCSLDWNERAGDMCNSLGAEEMNGWTVYHFVGDALENLAKTK